VQAEQIAARLWPGRAMQIETLGGGITNHNFKVAVGDEVFVLRIGGKDTDLLGIDREAEHAASLAAASLGIGPEVVAFVEPEGYLVTRFVEGRPIPVEEVRRPERLDELGATLRRVHDGPPFPSSFDSFRVVETYRETAAERGVEPPPFFAEAKRIADRIEAGLGARPPAPCHNDLLNANLIDDGDRIRIVDWEYAGMGERLFDLANFSINHELTAREDELLLSAYASEVDDTLRDGLTLMRFMSDFREAMWGVVQQAVSELDFDFVEYADEHFARLERTATDERFAEALGRAGSR
jgi:thiamine kinase-like enzyme